MFSKLIEKRFIGEAVQIIAILTLHQFYRKFLRHFFYDYFPEYTHNPYSGTSILTSVFDSWLLIIGAGVFITAHFIFYRQLEWQSFNHSKILRGFIFLIVFVQIWNFSTYPFNFYFNSWHAPDRLVLAALGSLVFLNPTFLAPFLIVLLIILSQFTVPLGSSFFLFHHLSFATLILFLAYLYIRALWDTPEYLYLFLLLCLIGANYFVPGLIKLLISPGGYEWVTSYEPVFAFATGNFWGWFSLFGDSTLWNVYKILAFFGTPLAIISVLIELSGILILWKRRLTVYLLIGFSFFHLFFFFLIGNLFWHWIVVNLATAILIIKARPELSEAIFRPEFFLAAVMIVGFSNFIGYFKTYPLAWYETRHVFRIDFNATTNRGESFQLNPGFFGPYKLFFERGYDRVPPYIDENTFTLGIKNYRKAKLINAQLNSKSALESLKATHGVNNYDPAERRTVKNFLKTYLRNFNSYQSPPGGWLSYVSPPAFRNVSQPDSRDQSFFRNQSGPSSPIIEELKLYFVEGYFDGSKNITTLEEQIFAVQFQN